MGVSGGLEGSVRPGVLNSTAVLGQGAAEREHKMIAFQALEVVQLVVMTVADRTLEAS